MYMSLSCILVTTSALSSEIVWFPSLLWSGLGITARHAPAYCDVATPWVRCGNTSCLLFCAFSDSTIPTGLYIIYYVAKSIVFCLIGASLSEPHINGYELREWDNIYMVRRSLPWCSNSATCKFTLVSVNVRYVAIDSSVSVGVSSTARGTSKKAKSRVLSSYPYSKWAAFILAGRQWERPRIRDLSGRWHRKSAWTTYQTEHYWATSA